MAILGKLLGIDQEKAVAALTTELKEALGGATIAEVLDKYGDSHKLKFRLGLTDNALSGEVWLENKEPKP